MNSSDKPFGKSALEPKKVIEEDANAGPWAKFGQQVQNELNQSSKSPNDESAIQGMGSSIFGSSKGSFDKIVNDVIQESKPILRLMIFICLVSMLYSWNKRLFSLGDFQVIDDRKQKCADINRFDYSGKAWHEKQIILNDNNLKARSASSKSMKMLTGGIKTIMGGLDNLKGLPSIVGKLHVAEMPHKPAPPYLVYKKERFDIVRQENPELERKQIEGKIKDGWLNLSKKEKSVYNRQFEESLKKYKEEEEKYRAQNIPIDSD